MNMNRWLSRSPLEHGSKYRIIAYCIENLVWILIFDDLAQASNATEFNCHQDHVNHTAARPNPMAGKNCKRTEKTISPLAIYAKDLLCRVVNAADVNG